MIPDSAVKKITKEAHKEIAVANLIAYGIFPFTEEGIAKAKQLVETKDTWLPPSSLPNYYDDIDSDLMTGKETAGIISIRNSLKEFYGLSSSPNVDVEDEEDDYDEEGLDDLLGLIADEKAAEEAEEEEDDYDEEALDNLLNDVSEEEIIEEDEESVPTGPSTFEYEKPDKVKHPKLYPELRYIKPKYMKGVHGLFDLVFESDIDKAIYFAGKAKLGDQSKVKNDVRQWLLDVTGLNWFEIKDREEIGSYREKIIQTITDIINNDKSAQSKLEVTVPIVYDGYFQDPEDEEEEEDDLDARMEAAFEGRLDDLLDSIREDEEDKPKQSKPKKPSKKRSKKSKLPKAKTKKSKKPKLSTYDLSRSKAPNFNAYIGGKIADAFKLAALARRNAKLSGAPQQEKGFFLKKALAHEFGGDLLRRGKGYLSSDPKESEDPALSRGKRFAATIADFIKPSTEEIVKPIDPNAPVQLSLFGDHKQVVSVNDSKLKDTLQKKTDALSKSFVKLDGILNSLVAKKTSGVEAKQNKTDKLADLVTKFEQVKDAIINSNKSQKTIVDIKQKQLAVVKDTLNDAKALQKESSIEAGQDLSSTFDYSFGKEKEEEKQQSTLEKLIGFVFGSDQPESPEGFDIPDIPDIDFDRNRRRRGARRRLARRKINRMVPRLPKRKEQKAVGEAAERLGREGAKKVAQKGAQKGVTKILGKTIGKLLPGVGTAYGIAEGVYRMAKGDTVGGLLSFGSAIPILGWGFTAIDMAREAMGGGKPPKKLSEGGVVNQGTKVMVGEAGPEAIIPLSSAGVPDILTSMAPTNPALHSVGVMLGVTKKVMTEVGPAAASVRPLIQNIISPLEKLYGAPSYALTTDIGEGLGNVSASRTKLMGGGDFLDVIKKFLGFGDEEGDGSSKETAINTGDDSSGGDNFTGGGGDWAPLLAIIRKAEGGYESISGRKPISGLTEWTIEKVASSAPSYAGAYQLDPDSLIGWAKDVGLSPQDKFSPANQDKIAIGLIEGRAQGKKWRSRQISDEKFGNNLATIWAGLPVLSSVNGKRRGSSYYAGVSWNKANVTPEEVEGAFKQIGSGSSTSSQPTLTARPQTSGGSQQPTMQPAAQQSSQKSSSKSTKLSPVFNPSSMSADSKTSSSLISSQPSAKPLVLPSVVEEERSLLAFVNKGIGSRPASLQSQGSSFDYNYQPSSVQPPSDYADILKLRLAVS